MNKGYCRIFACAGTRIFLLGNLQTGQELLERGQEKLETELGDIKELLKQVLSVRLHRTRTTGLGLYSSVKYETSPISILYIYMAYFAINK